MFLRKCSYGHLQFLNLKGEQKWSSFQYQNQYVHSRFLYHNVLSQNCLGRRWKGRKN